MKWISSGVRGRLERGHPDLRREQSSRKGHHEVLGSELEEKEVNGMELEFYAYHEKWKHIFSEIKR